MRYFEQAEIDKEVSFFTLGRSMHQIMARQPSNQAMERTADRCTLHI